MEEKLRDTKITIFEEYCMVSNKGTYFKIGLKEGRIISKLIDRKSVELIAKEENLMLDELYYIIDIFESNGVIGEKLKEKFNLLHIKIPLFDIDLQLEIICNLLRKYRAIRYFFVCLFTYFFDSIWGIKHCIHV